MTLCMIGLKLLEYSFCIFLKERFLHVPTKNLETFENASIRFNVHGCTKTELFKNAVAMMMPVRKFTEQGLTESCRKPLTTRL